MVVVDDIIVALNWLFYAVLGLLQLGIGEVTKSLVRDLWLGH